MKILFEALLLLGGAFIETTQTYVHCDGNDMKFVCGGKRGNFCKDNITKLKLLGLLFM